MGVKAVFQSFFKDKIKFYKFAVVGTSGAIVNVFFVWLGNKIIFLQFSETIKTPLSYVMAIFISVFTNYLLNQAWTWADRKTKGSGHFFILMGKYYLISSLAILIQFLTAMGVFVLIKSIFPPATDNIVILWKMCAICIGIVSAMFINFYINNNWTFSIIKIDKKQKVI